MRTILATLFLVIGLSNLAPAALKPNIVIILADDLGYSDLGCYGGEIQTPHLDALAKDGLRFTHCYNTARCWPSRAALMTGYYAQQVRRDALPGVTPAGTQGTRPAWAPLLPQYLKAAGYRSYHSGKWHIDGTPRLGGFESTAGLNENSHFASANAEESGYSSIKIADFAIESLKGHAAEHADKPFFSYVAFTAPHFPLHALPKDIAKYRQRYQEGWEKIREARHARQKTLGITSCELSKLEAEVGPPYHFPDALKKLGSGEVNRPLPWTILTDEQRAFQAAKMSIHAAMVDRMDQEIGRIIAQLKAMGAFENTLILFASDNGASAEIMVRGGGHDPRADPGSAATYLCLGPGFSSAANTPFRRHKTWVHEGGISTPLVVHWPKGITSKGELRHTPVHLIDVVPTMLSVVGLEKPKNWEGVDVPSAPGRSLTPAFAADVTIPRDYLWWLHENNKALRVGEWKIVATKNGPWELYNLSNDRGEQRDLSAAMPDKVKELSALWQKHLDDSIKFAKQTTNRKIE